MKVLMTADAVGGVWTYALELCAEFARRDVQIALAVMGPAPRPAQCRDATRIPGLQLHGADFKLEWMSEPWDDVERAGEWLQELAQREAVDLVHLNGYVHAALAWTQPVVVVAHSCVCSWWEAVHGVPAPAQWDGYRRRVSDGLRAADQLVAPTRAFLDELQRQYQPSTPACVIHNARTGGLYADAAHERSPQVLACGRLWDEAKNMRALNEAARSLAWPVCVAGADVAPDGARFSADALHVLGELTPEELAGWLKQSAIYAHPSKYEPFGLSVLEAALAGCALVLADLPSLREVWGDAAQYLPVDDANAMHDAIAHLISSPEKRTALANAAMERARRYSPNSMGDAYHKLYNALLARGRTRERAIA